MTDTSAVQQHPVAGMDDGASSDDPGPSSPLTLVVPCEAWDTLGDVDSIANRVLGAVSARVPVVAGREVAVVLAADADLRALNARFRAKDKPTNVLSFPHVGPPVPSPAGGAADDAVPLGDIVIAFETVMREADEENKPPLHHLAHMIVHGLLHLAGYDHETRAEAERMEDLEREILASMDIPDPHGPGADAVPYADRPCA